MTAPSGHPPNGVGAQPSHDLGQPGARLPKEHATGHAYEARSAMWQSVYSYYGFRPATPRRGEENYLVLEAGPAQWREMLLEESDLQGGH